MAMWKTSLSSRVTRNETSSLLTVLPARFPQTWLTIVETSPESQLDEADISELVVDQVQLLVAVWLAALLNGCVAGGSALTATHCRVYATFLVFRSASRSDLALSTA